jgi:Type I phosphodiesterase / nucleotide pyrophosphatase
MKRIIRYVFVACRTFLLQGRIPLFTCLLATMLLATEATTAPKVILISLDGATPWLVNQYLVSGVLSRHEGLGLLQSRGIKALRNITVCPSLTAPGHIAIATGSTAAANDIGANTFHLIVSPFTSNINGFAAPIGGCLVTLLPKTPPQPRNRSGWRCATPARRW